MFWQLLPRVPQGLIAGNIKASPSSIPELVDNQYGGG
jgi:hypothetical protein